MTFRRKVCHVQSVVFKGMETKDQSKTDKQRTS